MTSTTPSVLIATHPFGQTDPAPRRLLERTGARLIDNPYGRKLRPAELRELLADADAVVASTERYTPDVLDAAPRLRLVARTGVGMDGIDLDLMRERGIVVTWTPDAPSDSVAELAVGLAVALARQVLEADRAVRRGSWERRTGWLLGARTVGLVGLGRIGRRVARLLRPFGCRLLGADIDPAVAQTAAELGVEMASLEDLLARVDIVSLHVPLTAQTRGFLDAAALDRMRAGALLLNTARGEVVDEAALLAALESGRLGGAALDVFADEPYQGPLADRDDVILTCHMGSCSDEGRKAMELGAARAVAAFLRGESVPGRLR